MSMLSEQVKELKTVANKLTIGHNIAISEAIRQFRAAADTIEALSAKVAATNMERSTVYYNGGWIPCSERLPEVEQDVLLSFRSLDVRVGYRANTEDFFYVYGEEYITFENTLAWMPLPKPYKESEND